MAIVVSRACFDKHFTGKSGVKGLSFKRDGSIEIGVKECPQLSENGDCLLFSDPQRPLDCSRFVFEGNHCKYLRGTPIDKRTI